MLVVLSGLIVLLVLLARRLVVRPVERVTAAAGQVVAGALDARVEEGGAGEIATLTARFNEMAAALESREGVRAEQYRDGPSNEAWLDVALLDAVFDQSPVGLGLWDGELRFVRVNPALAAIDGVPAEAHIGRRLEEVVPDLGASAGDAVRRVLDSGGPVLEIELEGETPAAPGELRQWRASFFPIHTGGERSGGVAGLVVDTTDERRAARERERSRQRSGRRRPTGWRACTRPARRSLAPSRPPTCWPRSRTRGARPPGPTPSWSPCSTTVAATCRSRTPPDRPRRTAG